MSNVQKYETDNIIIVIPAYNPSAVLLELIAGLQEIGIQNIVCVNDGSTSSGTVFEKIESDFNTGGGYLLKHAVNFGRGIALKTAFNYILNYLPGKSIVITMDADGQHTVAAVEKIIQSYAGEREIILGARAMSSSKVKIPLRSRFGNAVTKWVFRYLCNIHIQDTQTGLRLYPAEILPEMLMVKGSRYEYETNCLLYCKDNNIGLKEVEIETIYEEGNASSHFNPLKDSLKIYSVIIKYMCSSFLSVAIDYIIFFSISKYVANIFLMTYLGRFCSAVVNFMVNRKVVFKNKGNFALQALKYIVLLLVSGTISAVLVQCGATLLGKSYLVFIKIVVELVLFFFNFYIQKNFVFVKKRSY